MGDDSIFVLEESITTPERTAYLTERFNFRKFDIPEFDYILGRHRLHQIRV